MLGILSMASETVLVMVWGIYNNLHLNVLSERFYCESLASRLNRERVLGRTRFLYDPEKWKLIARPGSEINDSRLNLVKHRKYQFWNFTVSPICLSTLLGIIPFPEEMDDRISST